MTNRDHVDDAATDPRSIEFLGDQTYLSSEKNWGTYMMIVGAIVLFFPGALAATTLTRTSEVPAGGAEGSIEARLERAPTPADLAGLDGGPELEETLAMVFFIDSRGAGKEPKFKRSKSGRKFSPPPVLDLMILASGNERDENVSILGRFVPVSKDESAFLLRMSQTMIEQTNAFAHVDMPGDRTESWRVLKSTTSKLSGQLTEFFGRFDRPRRVRIYRAVQTMSVADLIVSLGDGSRKERIEPSIFSTERISKEFGRVIKARCPNCTKVDLGRVGDIAGIMALRMSVHSDPAYSDSNDIREQRKAARARLISSIRSAPE